MLTRRDFLKTCNAGVLASTLGDFFVRSAYAAGSQERPEKKDCSVG